jgi:hypothetical protein
MSGRGNNAQLQHAPADQNLDQRRRERDQLLKKNDRLQAFSVARRELRRQAAPFYGAPLPPRVGRLTAIQSVTVRTKYVGIYRCELLAKISRTRPS